MTAGEQARGRAREALELLDWKRRVHALYAEVRAAADPAAAWARWRAVRDDLFARHPQSPLPPAARAGFAGLPVFAHDPALRVVAEADDAPPARLEIPTSGGGTTVFTRCGVARFLLAGAPQALELYWLEAYGGGVFLPFADATSGSETYGAGRYLLDTVKGADLGPEGTGLVLDFNFAYNPSCAYDPAWPCPLAPRENRLDVRIEAGELTPR